MISAQLDAATLSRVRLALSPAHEVVMWLRLAATGQRHPLFGDPGAAARWALRHPDVALVAQVQPEPGGPLTYMPDLLTPKPAPGSAARSFGEQLAVMRATPDEAAAHQVAALRFRNGPMPAQLRSALESGRFAERAANGVRQFWKDAIADEWTGMRGVLEADIEARSRTMAAYGVGQLLDTLHPGVTWTGTRLDVHKDAYEETIPLAGKELVLAPSTHGPVAVQLEKTGDFVLFYPAAGLGTALDRPRSPAMGRLLGRSRAALLGDLDSPRTTGELADRHRLAPATVSYHLGVLHRSGLVLRRRDRHVVRYRRSTEGDALLGEHRAQRAAR